ncbi:MAG: Uncharacterised protein [Glaciecola sp. HTCC2999]|nr:MAG: Uncharacterised protein [Glaciecola sp. HTCC2999]
MLHLLLTDPVAWGSVLGILIIVIMCAYYAYMFIHNSGDETK